MTIKKHSVKIQGHSTSVTIENIFWQGLQHIADEKKCSIAHLIQEIDATRTGNLSSAIRIYVMSHYTDFKS